MIRWRAGLVLLLALLLGVTLTAGIAAEKAASTAKMPQASEIVKITGTVVAAGKDGQGKINAVAIQTEKDQYRVVLKDKGRDLLKMVNKKVEASGTVKESKGKKRIHVTQYREAGK